MLSVLLIVILAQPAATEVHVDEDGFITVTEDPEARAREQEHIELLNEASRAGTAWREFREGDLVEVIEKHERVLESGMELEPKVRRGITSVLSLLYEERAMAPTPQERQHFQDIEERMRAGVIVQEDIDVMLEWFDSEEHRQHRKSALEYAEETLALLPEDAHIEAMRQLFKMAALAEAPGDPESARQGARYSLEARQRALAVLDSGQQHEQQEARGRASAAMQNVLARLRQNREADLCREFIETYTDDNELVTRLEMLLDELENEK